MWELGKIDAEALSHTIAHVYMASLTIITQLKVLLVHKQHAASLPLSFIYTSARSTVLDMVRFALQ